MTEPKQPPRLTPSVIELLRILFGEPEGSIWHPAELAERNGLPRGTVKEALRALEQDHGWLRNERESEESCRQHMGPPRHYYSFTATGRQEALDALRKRFPKLVVQGESR